MRINVWSINYAPELTGIAVYNTQMCEFLANRGDAVTMVTAFPYYPSWRKRSEDSGVLYASEQLKAVAVKRCWLFVPERPSVLTRIIHEASFAALSALRQLFLPAPDLYLVVSPPLGLGMAVWLVSKIKRAPFHFHVQDLQPDAAFGLNMLRNRWLGKLLYAMERFTYDEAASVSGISLQICRAINKKGVEQSKIIYFPNFVELPDTSTLPPSGTWKAKRGFAPATPIVSYAGNLGIKQGLKSIAEAAIALKGRSPAIFVIAGNGSQRRQLELWKEQFQLDNLIMESTLSEDEHTELLIDSEICLITESAGGGASFLPSKLLKTLALSRPVLTNTPEGTALWQAVKEGSFGSVVSSSDSDALAAAILELLADENLRKTMGKAGRVYVSQFESTSVLTEFRKHLSKIEQLVKDKTGVS